MSALTPKHKKGILLLSGGFDSPVAAHLIKKQGIVLEALHFSYAPYTDEFPLWKSLQLAQILGIPQLYVLQIGKFNALVKKTTNPRYFYVITRRMMWKLAKKLARDREADFLVTGENLGQVGSQTLTNMYVIEQAVKETPPSLPILRPVLCWDKQEIIQYAKAQGFYEFAKGEEACAALGPKNPITRATKEKVLKEEAKIPDYQQWFITLYENKEMIPEEKYKESIATLSKKQGFSLSAQKTEQKKKKTTCKK